MRLTAGLLLVIVISLAYPMTARGLQATQADVQRTVWDGVYTEEQAERGAVQYTESCAGCHAAGEIGPIGGRPFLHGHTAAIGLIRSRRAPEDH